MKKTIMVMLIISLCTGVMLTGCGKGEEPVELKPLSPEEPAPAGIPEGEDTVRVVRTLLHEWPLSRVELAEFPDLPGAPGRIVKTQLSAASAAVKARATTLSASAA